MPVLQLLLLPPPPVFQLLLLPLLYYFLPLLQAAKGLLLAQLLVALLHFFSLLFVFQPLLSPLRIFQLSRLPVKAQNTCLYLSASLDLLCRNILDRSANPNPNA